MRKGSAWPDTSAGNTSPITVLHEVEAQTVTAISNQLIRRLSMACPDCFKGIGQFPRTCGINLKDGTLYLCLVLDYESSLPTTLNTPWGWYGFVCLPLGLACAQDILKCVMDRILSHCDCLIGNADDVITHGKDDEEHGRHLHKLMEVAHEHTLVFSGGKFCQTAICDMSVRRVGHTLTLPRSAHCTTCLPPETPEQFQKLPSMVTYLSPFMPSLLSFTAPLCELLRKGMEFTWIESYQEAFHTMKHLFCTDITLQYFHIHKPITIQGWCLMERSWCHFTSRWLHSHLCHKSSSAHVVAICQHRAWNACCIFDVEWFHMFLTIHSLLRVTTNP